MFASPVNRKNTAARKRGHIMKYGLDPIPDSVKVNDFEIMTFRYSDGKQSRNITHTSRRFPYSNQHWDPDTSWAYGLRSKGSLNAHVVNHGEPLGGTKW